MCWCLSSYHSLLAADCFLTWNSAGFFLSREFSVIMVTPAYILPGANANETPHELHNAISNQKNDPPEGLFFFSPIVPGAFNHTKLKPAETKFYPQHFPQHCQKGQEYVWPILLQHLWLTQSRPRPPPGSFLPPLCFSLPSVQTTAQTSPGNKKNHQSFALWSHHNPTALLWEHRLQCIHGSNHLWLAHLPGGIHRLRSQRSRSRLSL